MKLLKIFRENFGLKVFVTLSLLLIIVASSFTCLFILHERKHLTDNLRRKGELIAKLLAYNSRLGVFAENKENRKVGHRKGKQIRKNCDTLVRRLEDRGLPFILKMRLMQSDSGRLCSRDHIIFQRSFHLLTTNPYMLKTM